MQKTAIQYADYVSNPLRVWDPAADKSGHACVKVNSGCTHCWAERFNKRMGTGLAYTQSNLEKVDAYLDEDELDRILKFKPRGPFKHGPMPFVFMADMTDFLLPVYEDFLERVLSACCARPDINFLFLTKRWKHLSRIFNLRVHSAGNVYLGLTIPERTPEFEHAIGALFELSISGWPTWISHEPALGPIAWPNYLDFLSFLVAGGETGPGFRADDANWYRSDRDWCIRHKKPFFFKQHAGRASDDLLDGESWHKMPDSPISFLNMPKQAGVMTF